MEVVNALGRRKRAVARVFVSEGTGKITINKRDLAQYFPSTILQYVVKQPSERRAVLSSGLILTSARAIARRKACD